MYYWEDMNSVRNLSYSLTDTRYVLLEKHEQRQKLLVHPKGVRGVREVAGTFKAVPIFLGEFVLLLVLP
jgi:hypothetical protein